MVWITINVKWEQELVPVIMFLEDGDEEVPTNGPAGIDAHTVRPPNTYTWADHGTNVASVVAALTNNVGCGGPMPFGMAGVAGGWGTNSCTGGGKTGTGVSLLGYRCGYGGAIIEGDVEDAVLDAVGKSTNPATLNHPQYGYGAHILNASVWQFDDDYTLRQNIAEAARQGAVFVTIKGNGGSSAINYPSDYDPQMDIIAVGASDISIRHGRHTPIPTIMLTCSHPEAMLQTRFACCKQGCLKILLGGGELRSLHLM